MVHTKVATINGIYNFIANFFYPKSFGVLDIRFIFLDFKFKYLDFSMTLDVKMINTEAVSTSI
jgi:hypothetical protein